MVKLMYKIKTLPCGIKAVCEKIPHVRSVSLGVRVAAGTRTESEEFWGISHFIEHMLFKGTETRSAREIAEFTDNFGAQLNAFTARDNTCFYIKAIDEHFEKCFEILSDMLLNSVFSTDDIKREQGVVLEEISMYEDAPEELLYDTLDEICFSGQAIGRNILGSEKSLMSFDKAKILRYMDMLYCADNMVISAAGNFEEERFFELAEKYFGGMKRLKANPPVKGTPMYTKGEKTSFKDIEQTHIGLAFPGTADTHEDMYAMSIVNNVLGGGMSSRLYQHIREELGLAYAVDSACTNYADCGITSVYAAVNPANEDRTKEEIIKEIKRIKSGLKPEEIRRACEQVKAACVLASEGIGGRMSGMSKQLLLLGGIQTDEEYIEKINGITNADIERITANYFDFDNMNTVIVRPEKN